MRRRAGSQVAWAAYLLPSARATPVGVELHLRAVSFVFKRGRSAESPADTSGARLAGLSKGSGYGGKSCGGGQTSGTDGASSTECAEQHRKAWNCIAARPVLFSSAMCAESPAGTEDARQAGLSNGSGYGGKSCGDGRQNRQTRGTDGAASAECASNTRKRGAALPCGQFCFQVRMFAESPADTSGAQLAGLPESSRRDERSCGGRQTNQRHGRQNRRACRRAAGETNAPRRRVWADQRHGRRGFCRMRERHRLAWNCIAARSVLFSSADVR